MNTFNNVMLEVHLVDTSSAALDPLQQLCRKFRPDSSTLFETVRAVFIQA